MKFTGFLKPSPHSQKKGEVCLLIDFENVVLGFRERYLDRPFDLSPLMELARGESKTGRVVLARAYADWRHFAAFTEHLVSLGVQAVQAPSYRHQGRNGTDIQIAVEAVDLVHLRPDLETFVIVTGDSDFNALVMTLHERGKNVIGVGVEGSISPYYEKVCDKFYRYGELIGLSQARNFTQPETSPTPAKVTPEITTPKPQRPPYSTQPAGSQNRKPPYSNGNHGNGAYAKAPVDPVIEALQTLHLEAYHILSARRLRELLPLVAEVLEQGQDSSYDSLRASLPKRFPDKINRQDATRVTRMLERISASGGTNSMSWMQAIPSDGESLFDGVMAVFARRLREVSRSGEVDPAVVGKVFLGENADIREVRMRIKRGRSLVQALEG